MPVIGMGAATAEQDLKSFQVQVGLQNTAFLNVNRSDAEASFKAFTTMAGQRHGYTLDIKIQVFDNAHTFAPVVTNQVIHILVIDVWDYLEINLGDNIEPRFVFARSGGPGEKYLLMTRQDSNFKSLSDLCGKEAVLVRSTNAKMGPKWLESLTREAQLGMPGDFFGKLELVEKPSLAALPVFFGKKQACIITRAGFEVMKELNPQVGRELAPLMVSDELIETIVCINRRDWPTPEGREELLRAIEELQQDPAGQQILRLFKAERALPFRPEHLETMRKLKATLSRGLVKDNP